MKISKIIYCLLILITACAPRGESKSLEEVYQLAKAKYISAKKDKVDAEKLKKVEDLFAIVEALPSKAVSDLNSDSTKVVEILNVLVEHSNYTVRPAMAELIGQYRGLEKATNVNAAAVKLLGARTINLLAREIESTAFKL